MPRLDPVTIATLSLRLNGDCMVLLLRPVALSPEIAERQPSYENSAGSL
jgi:hypothetical protein